MHNGERQVPPYLRIIMFGFVSVLYVSAKWGNAKTLLRFMIILLWKLWLQCLGLPDSKVHGANMGPTWVLSAPEGPHVGPMNLSIRAKFINDDYVWNSASILLMYQIKYQDDISSVTSIFYPFYFSDFIMLLANISWRMFIFVNTNVTIPSINTDNL